MDTASPAMMEAGSFPEEVPTAPNATNCSGSPGGVLQPKSATEATLVAVFLGILTLMTALANGGVIAAISTTRKLHLPANYLICSLAVTDLMVAALVMPPSTLYITAEAWWLGRITCEAWLSMDMTCCTCSILHLCAIALDRYWAITDAVQYARKRTARRAAATVATVWAISVSISLPPLFWRSHRALGAVPSSATQCIIEHDHVGYTLYSTFGAFYIPMAIILVLYYRIYAAAKALYQKRGSMRYLSGRSTDSQNSFASDPTLDLDRLHVTLRVPPCEVCSSSRERKAARILGLILGAFVLCWLPFFVKELLVGLHLLSPSPKVSDALTWLGYVNSLINPLLYTSFNEDFKQAFKKLFRCKDHTQTMHRPRAAHS
ncbi:5-hydroxytryptamine receptor 1E [Paramormyrops kingsleyae]|uniref:5-hydroxytryptamine receptor 1E n=1 Tax=Paramormyrops kingsleyae TaxID=1676925 RepID=A0A3B3TET3_9TELE|nr:5-hydroxytryptamine receptor 1E [Paramormyrops kingsleyae]